jgi:hypothetical protein
MRQFPDAEHFGSLYRIGMGIVEKVVKFRFGLSDNCESAVRPLQQLPMRGTKAPVIANYGIPPGLTLAPDKRVESYELFFNRLFDTNRSLIKAVG